MINTHKGLYRYNRLPCGVSSAPGIFQRVIKNILQGIPHVLVRMGHILVTETARANYLNNQKEVLSHFQAFEISFKREKCIFLVKAVVYLGHVVSVDGIRLVQEKVDDFEEMPSKTSRNFKFFLGMLNFYHRFLSNVSTVLAPLLLLNELEMGPGTNWLTNCLFGWTTDCKSA